jgi:hypothetical protein
MFRSKFLLLVLLVINLNAATKEEEVRSITSLVQFPSLDIAKKPYIRFSYQDPLLGILVGASWRNFELSVSDSRRFEWESGKLDEVSSKSFQFKWLYRDDLLVFAMHDPEFQDFVGVKWEFLPKLDNFYLGLGANIGSKGDPRALSGLDMGEDSRFVGLLGFEYETQDGSRLIFESNLRSKDSYTASLELSFLQNTKFMYAPFKDKKVQVVLGSFKFDTSKRDNSRRSSRKEDYDSGYENDSDLTNLFVND